MTGHFNRIPVCCSNCGRSGELWTWRHDTEWRFTSDLFVIAGNNKGNLAAPLLQCCACGSSQTTSSSLSARGLAPLAAALSPAAVTHNGHRSRPELRTG